MGPLDKFILSDDALKATADGFQLQFRSHWYRSLPLSCMQLKASINGNPIDEKNISIQANGNRYAISEMPGLDKEWLFITDAATLHIKYPEPINAGQQYEVAFNLDLFIPYILIGPQGNALLASSLVTKKLTCN